MPQCKQLKRKHRKPCIGDMDTIVKLMDRNITPPAFGDPDFDETFDKDNNVWAKVDTVSGKTVFDGVSKDVNISHIITINYDVSVTDETWIELDGKRLDILFSENLEERDEFLALTCTQRGSKVHEATKA